MTTPITLPPGPPESPFRQLLRYSFTPVEYLEDCAKYGETFTIRLAGFGTLVQLTRPDDIRAVFRGDPAVLHAGEGNALLSSVVGASSVLVLDDEAHVRQRKVMLPPLKGEPMRTFFDAMRLEALAVADKWADAGIVRADKAMQTVTLRVILRAALGREPLEEFEQLETTMARLLAHVRHPLALFMWNLFPLDKYQDSRVLPFYRMRRKFDSLLYKVIAQQRAVPPDQRPACLLTDLFGMRYDDGSSMTDLELRDAIVTVLAAGHDTTALSLSWAFEQILPRADVVERIESELEDVCGKDLPKPEHMASLEYLDAAIRESLRIRSIIPFVVRVLKDSFSTGGFTFPAGIVLCPSIHVLHMREDLYPEPRLFRPERFLERKFAPHEWNPFGGGNRACLGQALALYEMKVVLATLFSVLKMERPAGAVSKPARRGIAIGPHDGTRLSATRRRR